MDTQLRRLRREGVESGDMRRYTNAVNRLIEGGSEYALFAYHSDRMEETQIEPTISAELLGTLNVTQMRRNMQAAAVEKWNSDNFSSDRYIAQCSETWRDWQGRSCNELNELYGVESTGFKCQTCSILLRFKFAVVRLILTRKCPEPKFVPFDETKHCYVEDFAINYGQDYQEYETVVRIWSERHNSHVYRDRDTDDWHANETLECNERRIVARERQWQAECEEADEPWTW